MKELAALVLVALSPAGCAPEPGLVLTVDTASPDSMDRVVVALTATSAEGTACAPSHIVLTPACLPFDLAVTPGDTFGEELALVVAGTLADREVARREKIIPLAADRRVEDVVLLDPACYARCGPDSLCDGDSCVAAPDALSYLNGEVATLVETPCIDAPAGVCPE